MKKALLITLSAILLLTSLASCSRRGQYEDILESQKEAESLDDIPETNGNITGESAPDYATPVMQQTGNTPFYEGKTFEDMQAISHASGNNSISMIPTGRMYNNVDGTRTYFYNKLTGNFSDWCSDPLCDGNNCIWSRSDLVFQYVSDDHIYFLASIDEMGEEYGVFRCDFQRNNIEKVLDVAYYQVPRDDNGDGRIDGYYGYMDEVEVIYEKNNVLYYIQVAYDSNNADTIGSLYALNLANKEKQLVSSTIDLTSVMIANDSVYYSTKINPNDIYHANLDFTNSEIFLKNALAAESLLETIHENNIKDKTDVMWLISNIYLFMDNEEQSYEWAKKAHVLTADTPNDKSHQAFFSRAIRTGRIDESFGEIIEYRKIHPVIVSDWMKEIQMPAEATGEELIHALDEATGYSHEDYEEIENQFVSLYKTNSFMPNSVVLRHYGNDYVRFFWFASNHKLRVSNGSWNNIQAKQKLIEEHIFVDSLTLMLLQHYGCLDAIKEIPHVHICYSTLEVIQNNYHVWSASSDVHEILLWVKNATNVVFEPDGYVFESSLSSLFEEEYIKCCRCAATNDIPLLTIETSIEDFSKMEEQGSFKNIQTVGVVSLCHATLSKTPEKLNKTLYNLLGHCTFINFHAETIVAQIISNDYVVDKSALSRFFICNTSCDMISFERVYFGTLMLLFSEHRDAAIDFAMIVLENAVSIWRKGTHYRFLVERFNDEEARVKSESILRYLVLLLYDIEKIFKNGIPKKIQGSYDSIKRNIYKHFGNEIIQEVRSSLELLDD